VWKNKNLNNNSGLYIDISFFSHLISKSVLEYRAKITEIMTNVQIVMDLTVGVCSHFCNVNLVKMFGKRVFNLSLNVLTLTLFPLSLQLPVLSSSNRLDSTPDPVTSGASDTGPVSTWS